MTTIQVIQSDDGQTVLLPPGFELSSPEVAVRRQGDAIILEPIKQKLEWPERFFERIQIDDPTFIRPPQGVVPPAPEF